MPSRRTQAGRRLAHRAFGCCTAPARRTGRSRSRSISANNLAALAGSGERVRPQSTAAPARGAPHRWRPPPANLPERRAWTSPTTSSSAPGGTISLAAGRWADRFQRSPSAIGRSDPREGRTRARSHPDRPFRRRGGVRVGGIRGIFFEQGSLGSLACRHCRNSASICAGGGPAMGSGLATASLFTKCASVCLSACPVAKLRGKT